MSRKRAKGTASSSSRSSKHNVYEHPDALSRNALAISEGPSRKTWSKHDLRTIKPLTLLQDEMFHAFFNGDNICAHGSAGTGKTFIAIYLALTELLNPCSDIEQIILVRSVVPTREVGHLPGTLEEKTAIYELPYAEMFAEFLGHHNSYRDLKAAGKVQFCTTSFVRGLTWDNTIVIVDEGQNMTWHEINSIMTRLGQSSRIIFAGDLPQTDLARGREKTGMDKMLNVIKQMSDFTDIAFTVHDIVRSDFVKRWIMATEVVEAST